MNGNLPMTKQQAKICKVALIGDLCLDIFMQIPEYPQAGGDGLVQQMFKQGGGSVSNTAIALAHMGCDPFLFTHTGKDLWAEYLLKMLAEEGVILDQVVQEEHGSTGITFLAVTPDGERTMFTYRGANSRLDPSEITAEKFAGVAALHISGYACMTPPQSDAVEKSVAIANRMNASISLDLGVEPAYQIGDKLFRMLPNLSLLILDEPEAKAITGTTSLPAAVQWLIEHGVKLVGLKMGSRGCLLTTSERQVYVPGFQADVVDTTGAGDAFSAGMIVGLTQRWNLGSIGTLANAMGALSTTRWGAGAQMPTKVEVFEFLRAPRNQTDENRVWINDLLEKLAGY